MINEVTGIVIELSAQEKINDKLEKRKIILEVTEVGTERYYTNYYPIEFVNKNIPLLEGVAVGDEITLSINIKGKKTSTGKYFLSLEAFRKK